MDLMTYILCRKFSGGGEGGQGNFYIKPSKGIPMSDLSAQVQNLLAKSGKLKKEFVNELPAQGEDDVLYMIPAEDAKTNNAYEEYMYINGGWEKVGATEAKVESINPDTIDDYFQDGV